jgi:hypothetical protein
VIVFVLPIAENQFNYRYALAAVPLTVLAAALSTAQRADVPPAHGRALAPGRPEEPPAETDRDPALPRTGRVTELGGAG